MAIYPPPPPLFTCAICLSEYRCYRFPGYTPTLAIPPLCRSCSQDFGKGIGGIGDLNRDRRIIRMISALAMVIDIESNRRTLGESPLYG